MTFIEAKKTKERTSDLRKLTIGILLIVVDVSLIIVKGYANGILKTIFYRARYFVFISGFILGAVGMEDLFLQRQKMRYGVTEDLVDIHPDY